MIVSVYNLYASLHVYCTHTCTVVVLHATLRRRRALELPAVKADLTAGMPGVPLTPSLMVVLLRAFGVPLDRFLLDI